MQTAYPEITNQHREHLKQRGIKVYEPAPLPRSINPFSNEYWLNNCLLLGFSLLGRHYAGKRQAPKIIWSAAIVGIPFFAIISRSRIDSLDEIAGARKTLEQKLEYAPITRRALERALATNGEHQDQLKEQIQNLNLQIQLKKGSNN